MKNRNIQFKPTSRLLIPLLLACFAAVFISAPIPAAAGNQVPFNGTVSGQIPSDLGPPDETGCVFDFLVSNSGIATELGAFTGYAEFIPNLCDLTTLASFTGLRPTATKSPALSPGI